ncbi:hypothetical protein L208DRAFT_1425201 [Tricholoma matsutake]|nr:hypothetical protein L208DRAFT_1425201 [Tricholoma matsutake 945]
MHITYPLYPTTPPKSLNTVIKTAHTDAGSEIKVNCGHTSTPSKLSHTTLTESILNASTHPFISHAHLQMIGSIHAQTPRRSQILDMNTTISLSGVILHGPHVSDSGGSPCTSISQFHSGRNAPPSYTSSIMPAAALATIRYNIPRPDSLYCPPGNICWYFVITRGQEVGIFYDWHSTTARTQGIQGSFHLKYCTWDKALTVYRNAWNEPPICSITIMDSDSDEEGLDRSGNNTDNDEDFRVLFQSLAVCTCTDCWETKREVDLDFAATSLVV